MLSKILKVPFVQTCLIVEASNNRLTPLLKLFFINVFSYSNKNAPVENALNPVHSSYR